MIKNKWITMIFTLGATMMLGAMLAVPAFAHTLAAPTTCEWTDDGNFITADWDDNVTGATKYSVDVLAGYDTTGDGEADFFVETSMGTSERDDGGVMGDSDLSGIPMPQDQIDADSAGDPTDDLISVDVKVKALNSGKGKGHQKNAFGACADNNV